MTLAVRGVELVDALADERCADQNGSSEGEPRHKREPLRRDSDGGTLKDGPDNAAINAQGRAGRGRGQPTAHVADHRRYLVGRGEPLDER